MAWSPATPAPRTSTFAGASVPLHASQMFARNVLTLVQHLSTKEGALKIDPEDEITKAMLVTLNGQVPGGTGR